ncbi:MAG: 4Fe-4S dicluster domain-containing protein [Candidatus Bathyarchaeia archaeon]
MSEEEMVTIYVMGKGYRVPKSLTIMQAIEYAGYRFIRGSGCRGGFCGSCGTVYRTLDDYRLKVGLACQTVVEDNMYIAQIPFFPANKAIYDVNEAKPTGEQTLKLYPELARCLSCNTCRKVCPQEVEVMHAMQAALRGDIPRVANLTIDCIMCGLCAARCPAEIVPYNIGILARRLYAKHLVPKAMHLRVMLERIARGEFDEELEMLMKADEEMLRKLYSEREIEP